MKNRFFPAARCFAVAISFALGLAASVPSAGAQETLGGQKLTALQRVARLETLSEKGKNYTAKITFPVFRARNPVARAANAHIRRQTTSAYRAWLQNARTELKNLPASPAPYDFQIAPAPSFFVTRRLLSTGLDSYQYNGGAHGMTILTPLNFGLVKGRARLLNLGDFFQPNTPYRALVETRIFAKLRKDPNAMWVRDGSVKKLETSQFNNFSVERDGLRWLFNQYEMGPYAVGQFEVKLSLQELGPNFRREWLR